MEKTDKQLLFERMEAVNPDFNGGVNEEMWSPELESREREDENQINNKVRGLVEITIENFNNLINFIEELDDMTIDKLFSSTHITDLSKTDIYKFKETIEKLEKLKHNTLI